MSLPSVQALLKLGRLRIFILSIVLDLSTHSKALIHVV